MQRAQDGDSRAQLALAITYAVGDDVQQDLTAARHWYAMAARQDEPEAAFNLAAMQLHGEGGPQDIEEARRGYARVRDGQLRCERMAR